MRDKHCHIPRRSAGEQKTISLGKRLARLKRRVLDVLSRYQRLLGSPAAGPVQDDAFWASILTGEKERECPARDFRQVSFQLRKSGNLSAAEQVCGRGIAVYPSDLALAIEHAEIARAAKNQLARMSRWQRVLDLGGNNAPLAAYKNLADCHHALGNFDQAESIIRRGLEIYPGEFTLMERLPGIFSATGHSAKALAALKAIIEAHPAKDHGPTYVRMGIVLREEGMLGRAATILSEGIARFPESIELQNSLAELFFLLEQPSQPRQAGESVSVSTAHLFQERYAPFGHGTLCFHEGHNVFRQYVPAMLDFAKTVPPPDSARHLPEVDVFAVWGPPQAQNPVIREIAAAEGKPLLCLESGFLSSPGIEGKDHAAHSVIISPDRVYFDNIKPSYLENRLNSADYSLTEAQRVRSETAIASIVSHRLSKFNHAPRIDLSPRFPADGTKRILLVDQRRGGSSTHSSFGGQGSFERMWEAAIAMPDHQILVKLHPEVVSGRLRSYLQPLLPDRLPPNVVLIDFDVNPFDLFDVVDHVYVCTSQLGFEALMAGKEVHCFAAPFYAGWGLTTDRIIIPRRKYLRSLCDIFHLFYISHSRYFIPDQGVSDIEDLIDYFVARRSSTVTPGNERIVAPSAISTPAHQPANPLRILIIVHCGRFGASGRYLQNLAWSLCRLGCKVMVLAEGKCPVMENGVPWHSIEFEGTRLSRSLRREIVAFEPDIVYESGVRSRAQRAALEAMILTNARFAMQSEDDDIQAYKTHHGESATQAMAMLDKPVLDAGDIAGFLQLNNWKHTMDVAFDPGFDHWIEPVLRVLCYRLASLHTAIWHPFAQRLAAQYGVPTFVVPPVSSDADFERIPLSSEERRSVLARYGIDAAQVVFFLGGALYPFSNEYSVFLTALNIAFGKTEKKIALVISSGAGRPKLPIDSMARGCLHPDISFINLGKIDDLGYNEILKASDIVCSPGVTDTFNKFRLPSRLVKAMAMGKPVLTCRCGFGESLENGVNAFLTEGAEALNWAETIVACLDKDTRESVAKNGRIFAELHFNSDRVAAGLKKKFEAMMEEPPRMLSDGIAHESAIPDPDDASQLRRMTKAVLTERYASSMHDAVRLVEFLAGELGTVVHIGAGKCSELEDYCRLGAKHLLLVEALPELAACLKQLESHHGRICVKQAAVAEKQDRIQAYVCSNIRPNSDDQEELYLINPTHLLESRPSIRLQRTEHVETCTISQICEGLWFSGLNDMLVLELQGLEDESLKASPESLVHRFQWIAVCVSEMPLYEGGATLLSVTETLKEFGFDAIPSVPNFSGQKVATLFRKQTIDFKADA